MSRESVSQRFPRILRSGGVEACWSEACLLKSWTNAHSAAKQRSEHTASIDMERIR